MRYDTKHDYQAPPRYEPPARDERDEAARRYEPPSWHDAESARTDQVTGAPSDLDAAEPAAVAAQADAGGPEVARGEAAVPVDTPAPVESTEELGKLWPDDTVHDFQQRWREVQLRFVDDPRAAADEAQQLVAEALDRFTATLSDRRTELDSWRDGDGADTERMLMVVRRYRKLLDRLLEV